MYRHHYSLKTLLLYGTDCYDPVLSAQGFTYMLAVMAQMALLIICGTVWQALAPKHIPAKAHRRALTDLVFFILLPALVLDVIWRAPLDVSSLRISFMAISGLATGAVSMWLVLRFLNISNARKGALMLAATFPNATYLGLPVLDQVLGSWTNAIVLQYDLFACTPILMTLGILLARHYGSAATKLHPLRELSRVPPLWAVVTAIILNFANIEQPQIVHSFLSVLSGGVVPLMLIALGMSIRWDSLHFNHLPILLPVVVIVLFVAPSVVYMMSHLLGAAQHVSTTVVLIAAMPTMVFGIVICERYELDSAIYAAAVTLTTLCSILTLSWWFHMLPAG